MSVMKKLWKAVGTGAFWVSWPALRLYLQGSRRTRLILRGADGRLLLLKGWYSSNEWQLPGGGLHRNEDPVRGVCREVLEETGLIVPPDRLRFIKEMSVAEHGLRFRVLIFLADLPLEARLKPRWPEVAELAWQDSRQLPRLSPATAVILSHERDTLLK